MELTTPIGTLIFPLSSDFSAQLQTELHARFLDAISPTGFVGFHPTMIYTAPLVLSFYIKSQKVATF